MFFAMLTALPTLQSNAQTQQDTVSASVPDDIQFTEVGSEQDKAANSEIKDSVSKDTTTAVKDTKVQKTPEAKDSLWGIFIAGLIGGFIAFFLPCIYPMVPLTISFFTKRAETKGKGIRGAIIYGLSIIIIYVALGFIITLIFGAGALNELATDGIFNIFIFAVLLIFGISFLGAFEITLPSSFVNKIDSKSDSRGLGGIFFMAATLAVVSFSCTGPVIGSVLVAVSSTGDYLAPVVAMFGFSLSLALIFTVFAIFPSWLTSLPKSGGWLNSVKVVLGFLEIGLALKFLSTADLAYHWGILDREVFIAIWIVIAFILGFYLLGKIKFSHDSDIPYVSIPRLFLGGAAFTFAFYLIPGLLGAPLKAVSALVPPLSTQDFVIGQESASAVPAVSHAKRKYSDFLHLPHNIDGFFDYEEALAYAKKEKKPLFLDFTGHGCVNCRKMEASVWSDPRVLKKLKEDYVVVSLYTDDKTDLPENEQFESVILGSKDSPAKVNTVGKKFKHLQAERFNTISQPYYVLLGTDEKELVSPPIGVEFDIEKYLQYLDKGLSEFAKKQTNE